MWFVWKKRGGNCFFFFVVFCMEVVGKGWVFVFCLFWCLFFFVCLPQNNIKQKTHTKKKKMTVTGERRER